MLSRAPRGIAVRDSVGGRAPWHACGISLVLWVGVASRSVASGCCEKITIIACAIISFLCFEADYFSMRRGTKFATGG